MEPKKLRVQFERRVDSCWSWVVCTAAFIVQFLVLGTVNSFGSFFVALLQEFKGSEGDTAWIGSLAIGLTFLNGPLATSLCDRWGCRVVMCIGSVVYMIGMLLSSLVPHLQLMYITYGLLVGFAGSCCYYASFYALTLHFNKHLALATGIAFAGAGAGTMSISLALDTLISRYGLRTTFQGMAGVSVVLLLAGLTFGPVDVGEGDEKLFEQQAKVETKKRKKAQDRLLSSIRSLLRPAPVWKNKAFVIWTVTLSLTLIAYYIPYVYLVRLAEDIGIPTTDGALLVGYCALSQILGKIFFGKLADSPHISRLALTQTALLVMAVAACLCPLARSHTALLTYAVVSGFFDGCFVVMIGLVTQDIVGRQMMAKALGTMYGVVAIPMTIGPPMAGLLYDKTGNYNLVFFLTGGLVTSGVCLMFLIPLLLPPKQGSRKVIVAEYLETSDSASYKLCKVDDNDEMIGTEESQICFDKFCDTLDVERNRLLLDRANLGSRPSSFVLFNLVTAGSFRDLSSSSNERYSNSRAASRTSLVRLSEIKVESRSTSCSRLEPLAEADSASDGAITAASRSVDTLDAIVKPSPEITEALSWDSFRAPEMKADLMGKEGDPTSIIVSKSTESGFVSEDSANENSEADERTFLSPSKLDEKRLSGYSWNSTGSDLSWKSQSEADTEDSGFAEVATPYSSEIRAVKQGDLSATIDNRLINGDACPEFQESNTFQENENCSCNLTINSHELYRTEMCDIDAKEPENSLKEGPLILDPGSSDFYSQLVDHVTKKTEILGTSHFEDLPLCACAKEEEADAFGESNSTKTMKDYEPFIAEFPQPPDIFSEMFEGILEEVNDYMQSFSDLPSCNSNSLKMWPGDITTDLKALGRETEV